MAKAVLLTGCNLGDKRHNLKEARRRIALHVGPVLLQSAVYESEPWGFESPDTFLNQVLVCETTLAPLKLLAAIQEIETALGRIRPDGPVPAGEKHYASRTMDIDILFYDDLILESEKLMVPHPLICSREFVLIPLKEILGDFVHPVIRKKIKEL